MSAADELVDVVDAQDRVVGVVTRARMRAERLPHRCTYILVFDSDGRILAHERTATKDVFPSHWDVAVGGVLSAGEGYDAGAAREFAEELGVPPPSGGLTRLFPFAYSDERTTVFGMVYAATHPGPFRWQASEIVQGVFLDEQELAELVASRPFCPDGLQVLAEFQRRGGGTAWTGRRFVATGARE